MEGKIKKYSAGLILVLCIIFGLNKYSFYDSNTGEEAKAVSSRISSIEELRYEFEEKNINNDIKIEYPSDLNKYKITADLDVNKKELKVSQEVQYLNKCGKELREIYFHIYPNAYNRRDTTPAQFGFEKTFPNGFSRGGIDMKSIKDNKKKVNYEISGKDNSVLKLILNKPLKENESINLNMEYVLTIPNAKDRLGWYEKGFNFGNWYLIAAVYDEKGWHTDPYYSMGDPFYSDVSDYNVTIYVPKNYTAAFSGNVKEEVVEGNKKKYIVEAVSMRDFAWAANKKFLIKEGIVDGIKLKCYSLSENKVELNKQYLYAQNALKIFNRYFGKYPYDTYSVVETHFLTGMEYPGLVFITDDKYYKSIGFYETIICHETAHQWWYGAVGCDEVNEAWLDESLASYSEYIYYEKVYRNTMRNKNRIDVIKSCLDNYKGKQIILKPVNEFKQEDYSLLVYEKGALMHDTIRGIVGEEKFFEILSTYYDRYKFKNVHSEDYKKVVEEVTERSWEKFFDEWLLAA